MPDPIPERGQVVVRPEAVAICGSDLAAFQGHHPRMVPPLVLGHEFSGTTVGLGPGVPEDVMGRRVAVDTLVSCGECRACLAGRSNICAAYQVIGCRPNLPGAFSELVVVDANKVWQLPDDCSSVTGALVQPLSISHHAVVDRARVTAGDQVAIIGAGPVGLGALMVSVALGATTTVVDIDPYRLELARQIGSDQTLTPDEATDHGSEPDVVLECVGGRQSSTLTLAASWVGHGGRVVIVGNFATGMAGLDAATMKVKELEVLGSQGYVDSYGQVVEMIRSGAIDPLPMVSHCLPLDDPAAGLELLDNPAVEKAKVVMTRSPSGESERLLD
ncbi:MAG: zinc-dependent alcohol dehydrogenase [Acidimicrobiia bacterium]